MRLWDAVIPREQRAEWERLQRVTSRPKNVRDPEIAREIARTSTPPLRAGSCILARGDIAAEVQKSLLHFDGQRYQLVAWCVMPNHFHVAYTTLGEHDPDEIHHSWKSYTANRINKLVGREGTLWERESFDRMIRSIEHFEAFVRYIEYNPVEDKLCELPEEWEFSSAAYFAQG
jgi:REP element-mobilizing transposase RayT